MKKLLLLSAVLVAFPVAAQVRVEIDVPTVRFEVVPALVVIAPGIQVVPDYDEEVFVVGSHYWVRRGPHWYRARGHRGHWVKMKHAHVPPGLVKLPHGKYRRGKPARSEQRRHGEHDRRRGRDRDERRDDDGDGHRGNGKGKGKHRGRGH